MPRYSMNELTTIGWPLEKDVTYFVDHGIRTITAHRTKLETHGIEKGAALLKSAGIKVIAYQSGSFFSLNQPDAWPAQMDKLKRNVEITAALGADVVIFHTGPADALTYEEAEPRFVSIVEKVLPFAQGHRVKLAVEHASMLRMDLGYLGSLHNALDLADEINNPYFTVCMEVNNAWTERHLYANLSKRHRRIGIVQISDFKAGTTITPSRVPLGDGIIPLRRIMNALLNAGYGGYFDIELVGPHIDEMGYEEAIRRCLAYLEAFKLDT